MKSQVGLWIDHWEAVIVTLTNELEEIEQITSDVTELATAANASHVSQQVKYSKHKEAALSKYYGKLITSIHNAGSILIFGPGEAKNEFQKKLKRRGLSKHIVAIETSDSMTEAQVIAKVRQYFLS